MTCRVCAAAFAILCIGTLTMVGMVPRAGTSPRDRRRKRAKCRTCRNPSCIAPLVTTAGQTNVVRSLTLADISGRGTQLTRILTFKLTACQSTTLASERPVVSHSVDHRAASTNQACVPGTADIEGDWCLRRVLELGKDRRRVPAGWTVEASDRADCADGKNTSSRTAAAIAPLPFSVESCSPLAGERRTGERMAQRVPLVCFTACFVRSFTSSTSRCENRKLSSPIDAKCSVAAMVAFVHMRVPRRCPRGAA
jgi:hypothetical protein